MSQGRASDEAGRRRARPVAGRNLRWDLLPRAYGDYVVPGLKALAFDGANIWLANKVSNNVMKLASDGFNLGTFETVYPAIALAFDGANIRVANSGSNNVMKR